MLDKMVQGEDVKDYNKKIQEVQRTNKYNFEEMERVEEE